jgi:hypothetical protein
MLFLPHNLILSIQPFLMKKLFLILNLSFFIFLFDACNNAAEQSQQATIDSLTEIDNMIADSTSSTVQADTAAARPSNKPPAPLNEEHETKPIAALPEKDTITVNYESNKEANRAKPSIKAVRDIERLTSHHTNSTHTTSSIPNPTPTPIVLPTPPAVEKSTDFTKADLQYVIPDTMAVLQANLVSASLSFSKEDSSEATVSIYKEALAAKPAGVHHVAELKSLKVKVTNKVKLMLYESNIALDTAFKINSQNEQVQELDGKNPNYWRWEVTPLRKGNRKLTLLLYAIVKDASGKEIEKATNVYKSQVVMVTATTKAWWLEKWRLWIKTHWHYVMTVLVLPFLAWAGKIIRDKIMGNKKKEDA